MEAVFTTIENYYVVIVVPGMVLFSLHLLSKSYKWFRIMLDVLSALSIIPSSMFLYAYFIDTDAGTAGSLYDWYLILSMLSIGLLPLFIGLCLLLTAQLALRMVVSAQK